MSICDATATAAYLRHHLLGAGTVISLVADRAAGSDQPWKDLHRELVAERELVEGFLEQLDRGLPPIEHAAGVVAKVGVRVVLAVERRIRPGIDDLLEFELIRTGIAGKKCMWRLLRELSTAPFAGVDFAALLDQADRQATVLEERRVATGRSVLQAGADAKRG